MITVTLPSKGVETNGIGKPCSSHLNLTRSLADVAWHSPDHPTRGSDIFPRPSLTVKMGRPRGPSERTKIPYAGAE